MIDFKKHKYEVVEASAEDIGATKIKKSGIEVEFTLAQVEAEWAPIEKRVKEMDAQLKLAEQTRDNLLEHHPFLKDLTEEQLFTTHMYQEAMSFVKVLPEKIGEYEDALKESKEEYAYMVDKLGLKSKEEAVAKIVE